MTEKAEHTRESRERPSRRKPKGPPATDPGSFTQEELRCLSEEIRASHFPAAFRTELLLMEIDPFHLHASWHVSPEDFRRTKRRSESRRRKRASEPELTLRIFDVTGGVRVLFAELAVHGLDNNWYVKVNADGRSFQGELGWFLSGGTFAALAVSDVVHTPRAGPSPVEQYVEIPAGTEAELEYADFPYVAAGETESVTVPRDPPLPARELEANRALFAAEPYVPGAPPVPPEYAWWYSGAGPGWENCFKVEGEVRS